MYTLARVHLCFALLTRTTLTLTSHHIMSYHVVTTYYIMSCRNNQVLDELQASPTSGTTGASTTDSNSDSNSSGSGGSSNSGAINSSGSGAGVVGGRSFGDYDLADMTTTAAAYPPYNNLDSDNNNNNNNAGGSTSASTSSSVGRDLSLDLDNSGASGGGLKASDFVFPSDLTNTPTPGPDPVTSDSSSSGDSSSNGSPPNTAGMTKFQLQMSGQWNQQVCLSTRLLFSNPNNKLTYTTRLANVIII